MSNNIRTLGDYSRLNDGDIGDNDDVNNDDHHHYRPSTTTTTTTASTSSSVAPQDMFWSWNISSDPKWYHMLLLCTFPCFVGHPFSHVRKRDYLRLLRTFILYASIAQVIYFIVELSYRGRGFVKLSQNPMIGPSVDTMRRLGAKVAADIKYKYQVYRLFSAVFMHAGVIHLFMNLWMQWTIGLDFEKRWGFWRMACIFWLSGIGGNLMSCCLRPWSVSVGASGAIMGIVGARLSDVMCRWDRISESERVIYVSNLIFILVFNLGLVFSLNPSTTTTVDYPAHVGGLLVGIFTGLVLFCNELENKKSMVFSAVVGLFLTVSYFVSTSVSFALAVKVDYL